MLSVIIVSYHCLEYLKKCLESIDRYNDLGEDIEIIVVDNSSDSITMDWLKNNGNGVIAVSNENKGFGQANNVGAKISSGDYLLFLNPDTMLIEPVFAEAVRRLQADDQLGMFGVQLLDENRKKNSSYGLRMPLGFARTLLCDILTKCNIFIPKIMYTSGADIFIKKDVFMKAGMFDEAFFLYCEEADLCNRVNEAGYKNALYRDLHIIHFEGRATASSLYTFYVRQMTSRKLYCEKNHLDFQKFGRKERRYCRFKKTVFNLLGKKEIAGEYGRIIEYWDSVLKQ